MRHGCSGIHTDKKTKIKKKNPPPKSRSGVKMDDSQRHLVPNRERTGQLPACPASTEALPGLLTTLHLLKSEKDFSQGQIKTEVL